MTRDEFHRAYEQTPEDFRAELIGGRVHLPCPRTLEHGNLAGKLGMLISTYELNTPGVEGGRRVTILLADDSEPEPDLWLRIRPDHGGQSSTSPDDYIVGAPEMIVEIANDRQGIKFCGKRDDYARHGVREYLIASVKDHRLCAPDLRADPELCSGSDGIFRSRVFPGLWIDTHALFAAGYNRLMGTLQEGLRSREHAEFIVRLAAKNRSS